MPFPRVFLFVSQMVLRPARRPHVSLRLLPTPRLHIHTLGLVGLVVSLFPGGTAADESKILRRVDFIFLWMGLWSFDGIALHVLA